MGGAFVERWGEAVARVRDAGMVLADLPIGLIVIDTMVD